MYRVPLSTYRVQFNAGFTFDDARQIVGYLANLGITDLYASPVLKARRGSAHGYDVVDPDTLNPELGDDTQFDALHAELSTHSLGFLLDIVPNHMAASSENAWWMSVLENGPHSRFLHYFDIDWRPVTAHGRVEDKVLLPILGRPYGEALEEQEIALAFDAEGFFFMYYDKRLPAAPQSYAQVLRECVDALPDDGPAIEIRDLITTAEPVTNSRFLKDTLWRIYEQSPTFRDALNAAIAHLNGVKGQPDSFNALDALLDSQWYRLAYWRIASETINYRRFFDVTDLVGVRIESPEVFEARNRKHFEAIAQGKVSGLRIDHIDGLYDPLAYLRKLQMRLGNSEGGDASQNFYVVVEKILAHDEQLPSAFPVAGTTGYDFTDILNAVFIDPAGLAALDDFYRSFADYSCSFEDLCYQRRKQVIQELFFGELRVLAIRHLARLAAADRNARDFAPSDLLTALLEVTACMHVYRTYTREAPASDVDREWVRRAVGEARERAPSTLDPRLFEFLETVLLVEPPSYIEGEREAWLHFVMRWQQFTGRVMAKGVEDTAFYNFNRLLSLNEVGGEPGRGGSFDPVAEFHTRNERIARDWPDTLNATSTHDTKRSEDVRARLHVLSELSDLWPREARRWSRLNEPLRQDGVPDPNDELHIYQTLLGVWPLDDSEVAGVSARLRQYLEKAAREAKTHTSWIVPDADYERRLLEFGERLLTHEAFLAPFLRLQKRVAFHGFLNALTQVVLKTTSPGVPDFYQGTELWDFSLVDPDNRRPVDYSKRAALLDDLRSSPVDVTALLRRWKDGRVKLLTSWRALDVRSRHADAFRSGAYRAIESESPNVLAFTRGESVLVAVPRLTTQLVRTGTLPTGRAVWGERVLRGVPEGSWRNAFTGEGVETRDGQLDLANVFATFPVAILERV